MVVLSMYSVEVEHYLLKALILYLKTIQQNVVALYGIIVDIALHLIKTKALFK
jgi:hypothetical protein